VANIDQQVTFIDNYITQGVNAASCFAANDPVAIAPVLKKGPVEGHSPSSAMTPTPRPMRASGSSTRRSQRYRQGHDRQSGSAEKGDSAAFGIVTSTFTTPESGSLDFRNVGLCGASAIPN